MRNETPPTPKQHQYKRLKLNLDLKKTVLTLSHTSKSRA